MFIPDVRPEVSAMSTTMYESLACLLDRFDVPHDAHLMLGRLYDLLGGDTLTILMSIPI